MLTCSCVLTHEFPQGDVITIFVRKSRIVSSCREPLETVKITGVIEWSHVVEQNSTKVAAQLCLVDPQRGGRQSRNMPANIIVQVDFCHLRRLVPINNGADIADQSNGVWWVNRSTWVTGNMSAVTQEATGRSWMQKISPTVSPVRQYHRVRLWEVDTTVELLIPACIAAYRVGHVDDGDVHEGVVPGVTISAISASHATSGPVEPVAAFHGTPSTTFSRLRKAVPVSKIQVTLSQKPVGREVVWIDVELQPGDVVDVGLQPEVNRQQGTNSSRRASSSTVAQRGRSSHGTVEKSGAPAVPGPRQSARVETRRADLSGDAGPAPRHATTELGLQPEVNRQQGTNSSRRASSSTVAQRGRSSHGTVEKSGAPAVPGPRQSARVETRRADLSGDAGPAPRHATTERVPSGLDILAAVTLGEVQQGVLQVPPSAPEAQPFVPAAPAAKKPRLEGCRGPPVNKLPRLSAGTGFGELPALVFPDELGVDPLRVLAGEDTELVSATRIGRWMSKACTNLVWAYQDLRDKEHTEAEHTAVFDEFMAAHAVCSSPIGSRQNQLQIYMTQQRKLRRLTPYSTAGGRVKARKGMHAQATSEVLKTFVTTRGLDEPALLEYCTKLESTDDPHSVNEYKNRDGKLGKAQSNTKHWLDPVLVTSRRQCKVKGCTFIITMKVHGHRVETTAHPHHNHVVGGHLRPGGDNAKRACARLVRQHLTNQSDLGKCTTEKMWEHAQKTFRPGSGPLGDMDLLQWPRHSTDQKTGDVAVAFQFKLMETLKSCKKTVMKARRKLQASANIGHTKTDGLITPQQSAAITKEIVAVLKDRDRTTVLADDSIEYQQKCYALETTEDAVTSRSPSSRVDAKLVAYHLFSLWFMTRTLVAGARLIHPGGLEGHAVSIDHTFNINQASIPALTLIMVDGAGQALPSGMIQRASSKKHLQVLQTVNAYDKEAVAADCSFWGSLRVFMSDNDPTFKKAMVLAAAERGSRIMGQLQMVDLATGEVIDIVWGLGGSNYDPNLHACGVLGAAESTLNGRDATLGTAVVEVQCGVHAARRRDSGTWAPMRHPPPEERDLFDSIWGDDAGSDEEGEPEPTLGPKSKRKMSLCDQRPFLLAINVLERSSRDCTTFFYMLGLFVEKHESVWRYQIAGWLAGRYGKFGWMSWWGFIFNNTQAGEHYHHTAKDYIVRVAKDADDVELDSKGRLPVASDARITLKMLTEFYAAKFSRGGQVARHHYDWDNLGRYRKDQAMETCQKASEYIQKLLMLCQSQQKQRPKNQRESHKVIPVVLLPPILPAADVAQNDDGCASSVLQKAAADCQRIGAQIDEVNIDWAKKMTQAGAEYAGIGDAATSGDRALLARVMTGHTDYKTRKLAALEPQLTAATAKLRAAQKEGKGSQAQPRRRAYLPTSKLLRLFEDGEVTREDIIAEATRQAKAFCGTHHPFAGHRRQEQQDLQHVDFNDAAEKLSWFAYVVEDSGWEKDEAGAARCPFVSYTKWYCDHGGIDKYSCIAGMLLVDDWHLPDALTSYQQDTLPSNPLPGQSHRTRPKKLPTPVAKLHWCVELKDGALRPSNDVWGGTPFDPKTFARQQDDVPVKVKDRVTVRFKQGKQVKQGKQGEPDPAAGDKCSSSGKDVWMQGTVTAVDPSWVTVKYDIERAAYVHEAADFAAQRKGRRWEYTTATGKTSAGDAVASEFKKASRAKRATVRSSANSVDAVAPAVAAASNAVATVNEVKTMLADGMSKPEVRRVQNIGLGYCYWCALMDAAGQTITTASMKSFLKGVSKAALTLEGKSPRTGGAETAAKATAALQAIAAAPTALAWSRQKSEQQAHPNLLTAMHWGGSFDDATVAKVLKKRLVVFHTDNADGGADSSRAVQFVSVTTKNGKRQTLPRGHGCAPGSGSESEVRLTVAVLQAIIGKLKITAKDAVVVLDTADGGINHYEALRWESPSDDSSSTS